MGFIFTPYTPIATINNNLDEGAFGLNGALLSRTLRDENHRFLSFGSEAFCAGLINFTFPFSSL